MHLKLVTEKEISPHANQSIYYKMSPLARCWMGLLGFVRLIVASKFLLGALSLLDTPPPISTSPRCP
jgi:hypothetical protein